MRNAVARGFVDFYNSDNLTFAASIAYYSLLSLFPFFLMLLTIFGKLLSGVNEQTLVDVVIRGLPSHFDFVISQIRELTKMTPAFGVVHREVLKAREIQIASQAPHVRATSALPHVARRPTQADRCAVDRPRSGRPGVRESVSNPVAFLVSEVES